MGLFKNDLYWNLRAEGPWLWECVLYWFVYYTVRDMEKQTGVYVTMYITVRYRYNTYDNYTINVSEYNASCFFYKGMTFVCS